MVFRCLSGRDPVAVTKGKETSSKKRVRPSFPLHACSKCEYTVCHSCFNYQYNIACEKSGTSYGKWHAKQAQSETFPEVFSDGNKCRFCTKGTFREVEASKNLEASHPFVCHAWNNVRSAVSEDAKSLVAYGMPYWMDIEPFASAQSLCCARNDSSIDAFVSGPGLRFPTLKYESTDAEREKKAKHCVLYALEGTFVKILITQKKNAKTKRTKPPESDTKFFYRTFQSNRDDKLAQWLVARGDGPDRFAEIRMPLHTEKPLLYVQLKDHSAQDRKQYLTLVFKVVPSAQYARNQAHAHQPKALHNICYGPHSLHSVGMHCKSREFQSHGNLAYWQTHAQAGQSLLFVDSDAKHTSTRMLVRALEADRGFDTLIFDARELIASEANSKVPQLLKLFQDGFFTESTGAGPTLKSSATNLSKPKSISGFFHSSWLCENGVQEGLFPFDSRKAEAVRPLVVAVFGIDRIMQGLYSSGTEANQQFFAVKRHVENRAMAKNRPIQWIWSVNCALSVFLPFVFDNLAHFKLFQPANFGVFSAATVGSMHGGITPFSVFDLSSHKQMASLNAFGLHLKAIEHEIAAPEREEDPSPVGGALNTGLTVLEASKASQRSLYRPQQRPKRSFDGIVQALSDNLHRFLQAMLKVYFEKGDHQQQSIRVQMIRDAMRAKGFFQPDKELSVLSRELKTHGALTVRSDVYTFHDPEELQRAVLERANRSA